MVDDQIINKQNEDVAVDKAYVKGSSKEVNIPVVVIPVQHYRMIHTLLASVNANLNMVQRNCKNNMYSNIASIAEPLDPILQNLNMISKELENVLNEPYNKDCKK